MTEALEMLKYSCETARPGKRREKAVCPVCGEKYPWRPRGVGWGIYMGPNVCSWKCQREAEKRMEDEQKKATQSGFIKVSAFDGHLDEIKERIVAGERMTEIARGYDRTSMALTDWLQKQIGEEALDALKAEGRANKKNTRKSAKKEKAKMESADVHNDEVPEWLKESLDEINKEQDGKAKNRLVFEPVEDVPEQDVVPVRTLGPESTEAAWRALGVIEGICKTQLLEDYLPPIMAAMETIAEALR